jgi:hypothetical protein
MMIRRLPPGHHHERRGIVMIAVLVVVAVLSLAAYRFSDFMMAEYQAVNRYHRALQAKEAANSGVHYAAALLATFDPTQSGNPYDNPGLFQNVVVYDGDSTLSRVRFSIVAPPDPDAGAGATFRYGVMDEAGKINVNALLKLDSSGQIAHDILLKVPGMDEEKVNALLDWIDPDEEPRQNGAENEYYGTLQPPYKVKNGPLDTLEELLYVKGFTSQIVFGNDRNRNGVLDPAEDDGSGILDLGLSAYLTAFSREQNIDATGQQRIYVNDQDLNGLYDKLAAVIDNDALVAFIVATRRYGLQASSNSSSSAPRVAMTAAAVSPDGRMSVTITQAPGSGGTNATPVPGNWQDLSRNALNLGSGSGGQNQGQSLSSLYQLLSGSVTIPSTQPNGRSTVYQSPLSDASVREQYLPIILDKLTTQRGTDLPARVNALTAPRAVLAALPNMDDATVEAIIAARPPLTGSETPDPIYQTPAWLLTKANLPAQTLQSLERYITSRPQVYRVQVVGHYEGGGPTARVEAIIDTNAGRPRIVYYRDLTELGRAFRLQ